MKKTTIFPGEMSVSSGPKPIFDDFLGAGLLLGNQPCLCSSELCWRFLMTPRWLADDI